MNKDNPLGSLFIDASARFGERIAIDGRNRQLSYASLHRIVHNLAHHLQDHGIQRGSLVALAIDNSLIKSSVAVLALTLLGASWVDRKAGIGELKSIKVTHLLHTDPQRISNGTVIHLEPAWITDTDNHKPVGANDFPGYASAHDPWFIATSSGTTGTIKPMAISGQMFYERILRLTEYPDSEQPFIMRTFSRRATNLGCLHLLHTLHLGGTIVAGGKYPQLVSKRVNHVIGSPSQLTRFMSNSPEPDAPAIFEARVVGGSLHPNLLASLLKYFETVRVSYGSTETGPVATRLIHQHDQDRSVGSCYADITLQIVDDGGNSLPPEQEGVVRIKTSSQASGYLEHVDESTASFSEGWFFPGDRAYLSNAGELYVTGRTRDQINIGGLKFNANTIDEIIQGCENIADGMCWKQVHPDGAETLSILIAVVPAADMKATVRELTQALFPDHKKSSVRVNVYQVDAIPRNENGKIVRHRADELIDGHTPVAQL